MATRTSEAIAAAGLEAAYHAASVGGDKVDVGDRHFLHVVNADASEHTVTIATPGTVDGLAIADRAVAVPAGESRFIPIPRTYRNPTDGLAGLTWSATTGMTFAVLRR